MTPEGPVWLVAHWGQSWRRCSLEDACWHTHWAWCYREDVKLIHVLPILFTCGALGTACAYKVVQGRRLNAQAADRLLTTVEEIRQLKANRPLRLSLEGRGRLKQGAEGDLHRASFLQHMEDLGTAWTKVGLVPSGTDLAGAFTAVGAEAPAGYYDTADQVLRIVDRQNPRSELIEFAGLVRGRDLVDGEILAHEATHALQDMHFHLDHFLGSAPNDDAALARRCLAEGDASFVGYAYSSVFTPSMESWLRFLEGRASALDVKQAPDFVNRRFQLPYLQGARFVAMLHKKGGWKAVNAAYLDPPASTEEILHPDKYLQGRDRPVDVQLPNVKPFLGDSARLIWEDTTGELGFATVLSRERPAAERKLAPQPSDAANGWDGDRAAVHLFQGNQTLTWKLALDSPKDAQEAWGAYRMMVGRYPGFEVVKETPDLLEAKTGRVGVWLERRGDRVVILEGYPLDVQAKAASAVFAQADGHAFDAPGSSPAAVDAGPVSAPTDASFDDAGAPDAADAAVDGGAL